MAFKIVPAQMKYRWLYATWAFLECVGFGGLLYGWGSLVYVLKDEGLYMHLCGDEAANSTSTDTAAGAENTSYLTPNASESADKLGTTCDERDTMLNLVFTIAMALFCIGCYILGQINFAFGTRVTRLTSTVLFTIGALMIAFTSNDAPWIIFPGLALIGMSGITYMVTNFQYSLLFPSGGSTVVGLLSGAFDASSGVQLLVKMGHENGISRQTSYIIIACANLLTLINTFIFLPKDFVKKPELPKPENTVVADDETNVELMKVNGDALEKEDGATQKKMSVKSCLINPTYFLHVFWLAVLQLRFYFLLGSLNKILETTLDSNAEVSHYTNVLMYMMICGLFVSPFAGFVCDFFKRLFAKSRTEFKRDVMPAVIPLAVTTTLCIIMSGLVLVKDPRVLYGVFIFLLFFRAFLYTLAAGYISAIFPNNLFGILYGVLIITGGIISMFQYALFNWAEASGFQQVDIFLLAMMFITYCHPAYQWFQCVRKERSGQFQ